MYYWDKPKGLKIFGMRLEEAKLSKALAKNQGLYNGFLVAGMTWVIISKDNFEELAVFFLCCVTIAGIFGAFTTSKIRLFYVQVVLAILGLILFLL